MNFCLILIYWDPFCLSASLNSVKQRTLLLMNPCSSPCIGRLRTIAVPIWNANNKLHVQNHVCDLKSILKLNFCQSSGSVIFNPNFPPLATHSILLCKHLCWSCRCLLSCKSFSVCGNGRGSSYFNFAFSCGFYNSEFRPCPDGPSMSESIMHFLFHHSWTGSGHMVLSE